LNAFVGDVLQIIEPQEFELQREGLWFIVGVQGLGFRG
jgi:hypothetical protein